MPTRPIYRIRPGDRALVVGRLDAVPEAAGGLAIRIRVCDAVAQALPAE